jgi:hypothetical protein
MLSYFLQTCKLSYLTVVPAFKNPAYAKINIKLEEHASNYTSPSFFKINIKLETLQDVNYRTLQNQSQNKVLWS